jgi:putative redox protein
VETTFDSSGTTLVGSLAVPRGSSNHPLPGLVVSHGFPQSPGSASLDNRLFPELAERIATEMGWAVLTFSFRGCGSSSGNFSLDGWLTDVESAARHLGDVRELSGLWLAGFGTGGALSICAGARLPGVLGVAAMGAPADFDDWAGHPRRLLQHSRDLGVIRDQTFPPAADAWGRELREIRAIAAVGQLAPRALLVMHGADDDLVPVFDARVLADAHGDAELRIIDGSGHQLRYDPRAVAVLLGWLDRQRHRGEDA